MPPPRSQPPALSFAIAIAPDPSGRFSAETEPHHAPMQKPLDLIVGAKSFRACRDRPTVIRWTPSRVSPCEFSGLIANKQTKRGLIELARMGAGQLQEANMLVEGYLYAALATVVAASIEWRVGTRPHLPEVTIDNSPVKDEQFRVVGHWWSGAQQVVHLEKNGDVVRLRGLPFDQPFSAWANARILSRFTRQLSLTTGLPRPSRQLGRSAG